MWNRKRRYLVFAIVLMALGPRFQVEAAKKNNTTGYTTSEAVLQADLMSYADRYASIAAQAIDNVAALDPPAEIQRLFTADLVYSAAAAYTIAADADPQVALLDMVVLASLGRRIFEDQWTPVYGAFTEPVVMALTDLEGQAWRIAEGVLTAEQVTELRERITTFREVNPDLTTFSHLRFADFPSKRASSSLKASEGGGIFKSVRQITDQVEQTRMLAERGMFLSTRLPLLGGFFADIWVSRLSNNPSVEEVLGDVHTFAAISERLAIVAEELPEQITTERTATILQLADEFQAERIATVDHVFDNIAKERRLVLEQLAAEEQRLTGVLAELRATVEACHQLTLSVDALAERLDLGGESATDAYGEPVKPFDIEDYRQTLIQATTAIQDLDTLVGSTHRLIDSDGAGRLLPQVTTAIDEAGSMGENLVDRVFYRGLLFLVIALIGFVAARLTYRWIEERWFVAPE